jgi:hypothetical protein
VAMREEERKHWQMRDDLNGLYFRTAAK